MTFSISPRDTEYSAEMKMMRMERVQMRKVKILMRTRARLGKPDR
jgi:hypothetical protein